jgi:DNA polymerase III subunit delta'
MRKTRQRLYILFHGNPIRIGHRVSASEAERGEPRPQANPDLEGHDAVERDLLRLCQSARLPHAMLFGGPRGIGKATLAFRFARFVLAHVASAADSANDLAIAPESDTFRRVAAGGHPDLLMVGRVWDASRRRLRGEITVEQAREIAGFMHLTAAEEGWRIVIVDAAEEMNRNAANAVLKILEEPPRQTLLLLVSHNPGILLPTIRSRCRRFRLNVLPPPLVTILLRRYRPRLDPAEAAGLSALASGSIGRALALADGGGLALWRSLAELLRDVPRLDIRRLYTFVDSLAAAEAEAAYRAVGELLSHSLARLAAAGVRGRRMTDEAVAGESDIISRLAGAAEPARWARLRQEIDGNFAAVHELNLDRKQAMLGAFFAIAEAGR